LINSSQYDCLQGFVLCSEAPVHKV